MTARHEGLDGLRGVAAIIVAIYHIALLAHLTGPSSAILAVDFFFVLSGFVLARAYGPRLSAREISTPQFVRLRFIRLWPMFAAGLGLATAYLAVRAIPGGARSVAMVVASAGLEAFMLPVPPPISTEYVFPLNFPGWSLAYELAANAAFVLLAPRLSTRKLLAIVGAAAIWLVALSLKMHSMDGGSIWPTAGLGLARVTFGFFAGVLIARAPRLRLRRSDALALCCWMVLILALLCAPRGAEQTACAILLFPALVWVASSLEPLRLAPLMAKLGDISYPLYALHVPLALATLFALKIAFHGAPPAWISIAAPLTMALAMALLAPHFWDEPLRRRLSAIFVAPSLSGKPRRAIAPKSA